MNKITIIFCLILASFYSLSQEIKNDKIGVNVGFSFSDINKLRCNFSYLFKKHEFDIGAIYSLPNSFYETSGKLNGLSFGYQIYPNKNNKVLNLLFYAENNIYVYRTDELVINNGNPIYTYSVYENISTFQNELFIGQGFTINFYKYMYCQIDFGIGKTYRKYYIEDSVLNNPKSNFFSGQLRFKIGYLN